VDVPDDDDEEVKKEKEDDEEDKDGEDDSYPDHDEEPPDQEYYEQESFYEGESPEEEVVVADACHNIRDILREEFLLLRKLLSKMMMLDMSARKVNFSGVMYAASTRKRNNPRMLMQIIASSP